METLAKDIMTRELIVGNPEMTIGEAIKILVNNRITGMPILDEKKRVIGVVSEYDIIKTVKDDSPLDLTRPVEYIKKVSTITEETSFREILKHFTEKKIRRLPVLNTQEQLVGIITQRDIMRVLFYRSKEV